jgi:hypothetical protein
MNRVLEYLQFHYRIDGRDDPPFLAALDEIVEQAKKELSTNEKTVIRSSALADRHSRAIDVDLRISRSEFESMIEPDIRSSIGLIKEVLANIALAAKGVDWVLPVGASCRIPLIRTSLAENFDPTQILAEQDPGQSVSRGAALVAAHLERFFLQPQSAGDQPLPLQVAQHSVPPAVARQDSSSDPSPGNGRAVDSEGAGPNEKGHNSDSDRDRLLPVADTHSSVSSRAISSSESTSVSLPSTPSVPT